MPLAPARERSNAERLFASGEQREDKASGLRGASFASSRVRAQWQEVRSSREARG